MKYRIDAVSLVLTVNKKEQAWLQKQKVTNFAFESDNFLYDLLECLFTNDEFTWLPEGTTGDLTSAPMIGVLGEEIYGSPSLKERVGFYHVGRDVDEVFRPVLRRWAFMDYAVTSPQAQLADLGECSWEGGEYYGTQKAAEAFVVGAIKREMRS